jgi:hypothetical protein
VEITKRRITYPLENTGMPGYSGDATPPRSKEAGI